MAKEKSDKDQPARFIEKAKELGADESGKTFERAFERIVPAKDTTVKPKADHSHQGVKPTSS